VSKRINTFRHQEQNIEIFSRLYSTGAVHIAALIIFFTIADKLEKFVSGAVLFLHFFIIDENEFSLYVRNGELRIVLDRLNIGGFFNILKYCILVILHNFSSEVLKKNLKCEIALFLFTILQIFIIIKIG
jgi:hypothetical protein